MDQEREVQKVLDSYNPQGWKVVQFEWNSTKVTIFKLIAILIITLITLGFVSYWIGFSIIFERDDEAEVNRLKNKAATNEEKARLYDSK